MSALSTAADPDKVRPKTKKAKQQAKTKKTQAKQQAKAQTKQQAQPKQAQSTHKSSPIRLLREREVLARVGLKQTRLKELVESGEFPGPVLITPGGRALGYVDREVDEYIESRIRARDEENT